MEPAISVIISTYNDRQWLTKKLGEIVGQTFFERAEFLFVETASPGGEREELEPFCRRHANCRLLVSDERRTLYEAWNMGWGEARAPLLCYSNMDDTMHPCLLEEVVGAFRRHDWEVGTVLIAKQGVSDPDRDTWGKARLRRLALSRRPGPFTVWRRELDQRLGRFDGRFIGAGDKDFWARVGAEGVRHGVVPLMLYLYTKSPGQLSKGGGAGGRRERDAALAREKSYPMEWPGRLRRRLTWMDWAHRIWPGRYWRPCP